MPKQKQYLLASAAVLATLLVSPATSAGFEFYMLSLVWPASACNIRKDNCKTPIPNYFTIHGLWPHFANDTPVPPYSKDPTCTSTTPTPVTDLLTAIQPIVNLLNTTWPNLIVNKTNSEFWQHEWTKHGMCSEYPDQPKEYFNAALTLAGNYDPLQDMGIQPGAQTTTGTVLSNVYNKLRAYPQISCNKKDGQVLQLLEVRFCFDRTKPPSRLRSCPARFDGQNCKTWGDNITFPSSSTLGLPNMIRQVISSI